MADMFISYAREDQARVRELHDACVARGRESWVDWEGIEPSDTWLQSIYEAIDAADAVVIVLSPDWLASEVCRLEADHAIAAGKRLIPVVARDVDDVRGDVPPALSELNWIFARLTDSIDNAADAVVRALDTNLDLVRTHTLVLTRARAWELAGRRRSPLLRGDELARAESWVARAAAGALPKPTELQAAFVAESRRAAQARTRWAVGGSTSVAVVASVLAIFALISRSRAIHESHIAFGRELTADSTAQLTADPELSLLLAQQAIHTDASSAARLAFVTALDDTTVRGLVHFGGPGVIAVSWSPDRNVVALAGQNGLVGLWDVATGRITATMRANGHAVDAVAFSPDGKLLASAGSDDEVHLWDVSTRRLVRTIAGHSGLVDALAFSPDGRYLASGAYDGTAIVSLVSSGAPVLRLEDPGQHGGQITGVAIGPGDRFVVTADATDGYTAVWRDVGGKWTPLGYRPQLASQSPRQLALSPNGTDVAIAGDDGVVRVWRWQSGKAPATRAASTDPLLAVAFSRDGSLLAAGGLDGSARVWDAASGRLVETAAGDRSAVDGVAFSPDGSSLATAGADGTARVWKVTAWSGAQTHIVTPAGGYAELPAGALEPNGEIVLAENGASVVRAWRLHGGGQLWQRALNAGGSGCVCALAADATASFAAVGTASGVDLLSTTNGRIVRSLSGPSPDAVAIASHEPLVAAGGSDHEVRVWNGATGARELAVKLPRSAGDVYSLAFSVDGRTLAVGLESGAVELVDAEHGRVSRTLTGPKGPVDGVAFSPDGSLLAGASSDKRIWLWRASSGSLVRAFGDDTGPVSSVSFSPDGKLIASSSDDRTARVWDVATGGEVRLLAGDTDWVDWIGFSGDGASVATTSLDGTLRVWDSCSWCGSTTELDQHARHALVRCFTADEREDYLHERHAVNEACSA